MNEYKIRVKRDGVWYYLELQPGQKVKYNVIVNKIGDPSKREISHSNTYTLPNTRKNRNALGINQFNSSQLASSLNKKYECEIVIREKIEQKGFLVINRTERKEIKINIIDRALDLLDKWGAITLFDLLNGDLFNNLSSDYQTAVNEMKSYSIGDGTTLLTQLSNISGKSFPVAHFPNNLNTIGDDFNTLDSGDRVPVDHINTYQSRPVWNVKAFLDIITSAYGYTLDIDPSVNLNRLRSNYIVAEGMAEGEEFEILECLTDAPEYNAAWDQDPEFADIYYKRVQTSFVPGCGIKDKPNDVPGWPVIASLEGTAYKEDDCIYLPQDFSGSLNMSCTLQDLPTFSEYPDYRFIMKIVYIDSITGDVTLVDMIKDTHYTAEFDYSNWIDVLDLESNFSIDIDKSVLIASGDNYLKGIFIQVQGRLTVRPDLPSRMSPQKIKIFEEYTTDQLTYDNNIQYFLNDTVNLTKNSPSESIKELFSALLKEQFLLSYIDSTNKTVKIFNYLTYLGKINTQTGYNWSDYLLRNEGLKYDTNIKGDYGKINKISLNDPFPGNSYFLNLPNQGEDSKFPDKKEFQNPLFKDVSDVKSVNVGGIYTYFEYTNEGLGLVSYAGNVSGLTQTRADGTTTVSGASVSKFQNVNYLTLTTGSFYWYEIIDNGLRVKGLFLIPKIVINTLDLTKPVYVNEARGYMIIEEIKEYVDGQTPVEVVFLLPN